MDCLKGMKQMEEDSVDLIVTDPPYGYSFMGKDWDKAVPKVEIWKECLRVLKPGAFCFVMSAPRQDVQSRMIVNLQDAGFEVAFTPLFWAYASGFPKAGNISKMVDKRNGRNSEQYKDLGKYLKDKRGERPQKDISKLFPSKTGGLTGCVANWELGLNIPTKEQWIILKEILDLDNRFDELIEREEAEREVIGKDKHFGKAGNSLGIGGQEWDITKSATPQAKSLDGSYSGFQPKPAVEIILVAMKPLSEKTYVDQALCNGHGITWLDDCRIPLINEMKISATSSTGFNNNTYNKGEGRLYSNIGRFPANLLVSDDILNNGEITKSVARPPRKCINPQGNTFMIDKSTGQEHNDSGSFSRYFDLDKWHINKLPKSAQKTFPFMIIPKASSGEKNEGCEEFEGKYMDESRKVGSSGGTNPRNRGAETQRKNFHPTVKPTKLMSYLITLGSREQDIILDPFMGSGTTAIASRELSREFIGFEMDKEYHKIAEARIKKHIEQKKLFEVI